MHKPFNKLTLLFTLVLGACGSHGPIEKYSTRYVDRPYTLPSGLTTWKVLSDFTIPESRSSGVSIAPLVWDQSLNDSWTLEWTPLPVSARYEISKSDDLLWGLNFGIAIGYSSTYGWATAPHAGLVNRVKIDSDVSLLTAFSLWTAFWSRYSARSINYSMSTAPVFQLSDSFALGPEVGIVKVANSYESEPIPTLFTSLGYLGAIVDWRISSQWDLFLHYNRVSVGAVGENLIQSELSYIW